MSNKNQNSSSNETRPCKACKQQFDLNELDLDDHCFDCANMDPGYEVDTKAMTQTLLTSALEGLAKAKGMTTQQMTNKLVQESVSNSVLVKRPTKVLN